MKKNIPQVFLSPEQITDRKKGVKLQKEERMDIIQGSGNNHIWLWKCNIF